MLPNAFCAHNLDKLGHISVSSLSIFEIKTLIPHNFFLIFAWCRLFLPLGNKKLILKFEADVLITCIHNYHEIRSLLRLSWALARSLSFRDKTIISLQVLNQFSWLKHRFNVFFSKSGHGALGFSIRKEKIRFYVSVRIRKLFTAPMGPLWCCQMHSLLIILTNLIIFQWVFCQFLRLKHLSCIIFS